MAWQVLMLADDEGLLCNFESFSDAQLWALVFELRASGGSEAAAAAVAAARGHTIVLTSAAPEGAYAAVVAVLRERRDLVAQRVARHLATLSLEQRTAAMAELDSLYTPAV